MIVLAIALLLIFLTSEEEDGQLLSLILFLGALLASL